MPFPCTNRPVEQHRPVVVVGLHDEAGSDSLRWVLMITSATHRRRSGDIEVTDLNLDDVPAASIVRTAKIATIAAETAERRGVLPPRDRALVGASVSVILGREIAPSPIPRAV